MTHPAEQPSLPIRRLAHHLKDAFLQTGIPDTPDNSIIPGDASFLVMAKHLDKLYHLTTRRKA